MKDSNHSISDQFQIDAGKEKKWYGQEVGVEADQVFIDEAKGKPVIIRQFEFSFNPETVRKIRQKKIPAPTRQELFNAHWPQIKVMLWGDGLVAIEEAEFPPHVIVGKKRYKILLTCQPRMGTIVNDKFRTISNLPKHLTNEK